MVTGGVQRLAVSWVITEELIARAEAESERLFDVVKEGTYPPEWPAVAWLAKHIAGGRCEHCGRRRRLAVHHLDRQKWNLQHWNLVALCWERCHLWVETQISLDRDQLELFGERLPWLAWRLVDRERWPAPPAPPGPARAVAPALPAALDGMRAAGQPCACGCGEWVVPAPHQGRRRRYFSPACRQRVYREGRREQLSLLGRGRAG